MNIGEPRERRNLFKYCQYSRMIIVILGKTHKYESIEQIQAELNHKILELSPGDCSNIKEIPYLSTHKTVHVHDYIYEDAEMWV